MISPTQVICFSFPDSGVTLLSWDWGATNCAVSLQYLYCSPALHRWHAASESPHECWGGQVGFYQSSLFHVWLKHFEFNDHRRRLPWHASPDVPLCSEEGSAYIDEQVPGVVLKGGRLQYKLRHNLFVILPVWERPEAVLHNLFLTFNQNLSFMKLNREKYVKIYKDLIF